VNHVDDEKRALANRMAASSPFRKSPRLREFLLFVVERSLAGHADEINESEIGCRVFGRESGYDPTEDSIVRTTARQLRQKVREYFEGEGRDEPWTLEIPKGGYAPVFHRKDKPAPAQRRSRPALLLAGGAVLLLAAVVWLARENYLLRAGRKPPQPPSLLSHLIWNSPQPTKVVLADFGLMLAQVNARRHFTLREYTEHGYNPHEEGAQIWNILRRNPVTGIGAIEVAGAALRAAGSRSGGVQLRHARNMVARDFKTGEFFVLVGSAVSNPWFTLYEDRLNFRFDPAEDIYDNSFQNAAPQAGEKPLYSLTKSESYARLALVSNHLGSGKVLLVGGLSMPAVEAAGEFASNPGRLPEVLKLFEAGGLDALPDFEILLRISAIDAAPREARVVAFRKK
jgi:hypothetical protein